ncbi:MAG: hypothetical protein MNPFHGCM_00282 [Gemmatimonadaceae bacterium]|nr:hypothetical protein [Gemmatimonadaceae bacterium]
MRSRTRLSLVAIHLLLPIALQAQGWIIPRPCDPTPPPACRGAECDDARRHPPPCGPVNRITRTSNEVRAELVGRAVRFEVSETFLNRGSTVGEADYVFPLPAGAAFESLQLSINGEMVSGETLAADRARHIYEDIVRRMRDPALVEWMGSGMLRTRIFPIQPGETKRVVVRFQALARRDGNAIRVDYARGSAPKGSAGPSMTPVTMRDDTHPGESGRLFTLTYPTSTDYASAYSPTHTLRSRVRAGRHIVTAEGDAPALTILLPLRQPTATSISVLANRPDRDESGYALIAVTPPAAQGRTTPRDVTFVVDVSGSMRGDKLRQAKAAGRQLLSSLGRIDRFRLIDFSTDVREFREGWTPATDASIAAALRYLENLVAEGSTNISGALEEALDSHTIDGRLPLVVFVTDGEPTVGERSPESIAARVARLRGDTRLFTVGVSADVNTTLVEQLALEGRGTAHFVRPGESVEQAVSLLATRLASPVITDVRVRADGVTLRQLQPQLPVDLYAGQDLILLARYVGSGEATIRLDGRTVDGPVHWTTRVAFPAQERDNPFVGRLWAAQRIGWLTAEKRRGGGTAELDHEIRSLGERFGIPTEFSSYLVVEPGMQLTGVRGGVRRKADGSAADIAPAPAMSGEQAGRLSELRFEAAKAASAQRAATNTAVLDSLSGASERDAVRRIGARVFYLRDGTWTDARYVPSMRSVRVKAFSPLYFELVRRLVGLGDALVVGERAVVAGRAIAVVVAADGKERLDDRDLTELATLW